MSTYFWPKECLRISDLDDRTNPYITLTALIVSIIEATPYRFYVTDLTTNKDVIDSYAINRFIGGNTDDTIPEDQVFHIDVYAEKLAPFARDLMQKRSVSVMMNGKIRNILSQGIFVKMDIQLKRYKGTLEGKARKIELIDQSNRNLNLDHPIFKNVVTNLPEQFLLASRSAYERTLGAIFIDKVLNGEPIAARVPAVRPPLNSSPNSTPTPAPNPITNIVRNGRNSLEPPDSPLSERNLKLSSVPDLPTDSSHEDDYRERTASALQRPGDRPKKKQKISANYIKRLNDIEEVDGKVYDLIGFILEFEPLMNQLCIKADISGRPFLNPINILVGATLSKEGEIPDELSVIRISLESRTEILTFLGMTELEEVYIKSKDIQAIFVRILKSRKPYEFHVVRKLIKVNKHGNYILGWEAVDLTLEKILKEMESD